MTLTASNISVTTSATQIVASASTRNYVWIYNNGTNTVLLGADASVTTSNGFPLLVGETYVEENYTGAIYGIAAATQDVRYIQIVGVY